jgi:hypothetical protein
MDRSHHPSGCVLVERAPEPLDIGELRHATELRRRRRLARCRGPRSALAVAEARAPGAGRRGLAGLALGRALPQDAHDRSDLTLEALSSVGH